MIWNSQARAIAASRSWWRKRQALVKQSCTTSSASAREPVSAQALRSRNR